ncbi:hypothetical protein [Sorangium sp. So ce1182]|uniref:hypothetical protein n=1 Tax=Sorangium sp. So ce1182 TaxID=3133334 RepID=UPI003F5EF3C7
MSTWIGAVVETRGREDFWDILRRHGVELLATGAPPAFAFIECTKAFSALAPPAFSGALSRDVGGMVLAFFAQTNVDVYELQCFRSGERVRLLEYTRDRGGWLKQEGEVQPWERSFFFEEGSTVDGAAWPDLLDTELSELSGEDRARYEAAKRSGDATPVLDLLHPHSTRPLHRLCASFGVDPSAPVGRWRPPRSAKPWLLLGVVLAFFVGMSLLGALTRR